jgi:inorganic pyrophosphatase
VLLHYVFVVNGDLDPTDIPMLLVGYGFGASFVALFMQLGGGIYTKAADVGEFFVYSVYIDDCFIANVTPNTFSHRS